MIVLWMKSLKLRAVDLARVMHRGSPDTHFHYDKVAGKKAVSFVPQRVIND